MDKPNYTVNPLELLVKQFGETHRQAFAVAIRAAYEQGSEDTLGKIQSYQEAQKLLEDLSIAASDMVRIFDRLGDYLVLQGENEKFLLDKQSPLRSRLSEKVLEVFMYLSWHCSRCGNLLQKSDSGNVSVSYSVAGHTNVCESCYIALDSRLSGATGTD